MGKRNKLARLAVPALGSVTLGSLALGLLLVAHSGCGSQEDAIFDEQSDSVASEQEGEEFDSQEQNGEESNVANAQEGGQDLEDEGFVDDEESIDDEASGEEDVDGIPDHSAAGGQDDATEEEEDFGPMDRDTLSVGCDLIEGEYWEEDDEFGCELESGNELLCNDDGECTSGVMMSLDDILERLNILEYYPSILELRVVATLNNGQGPLQNMAGEFIIIEGETPCNNTGNVYVEIGENVECVCDIGFIEVGTKEDGFPMCVHDWNDGGNDTPPPPPQPDPPPPPPLPDPEPTCSEEEFLRDMKRAEQDYKQCIFGAVDSLGTALKAGVVALGASFLTLGTTAPVLLGELSAVTIGSLVLEDSYDSAISSCEYSFCTSIKRTMEDCNIPVPADPPDTLCDDSW